MAVGSTLGPPLSWNERLVGKDLVSSRRGIIATGVEVEDDFDFIEGDITRSIVNGIPLIIFSERVQHFLGKDMANTIVIKLLGRNIGFATLHNRVSILWRPLMPFQLMDIENGYFLAKF
ncbi:hypothetical protein Godav_002408 [Gossypium davidsonii]|uniref:Uncharacterized protein n=2 Tax=Gossypium TaxID=3633 RepID=A0A7J8SWG6_GOSDV|nr:hypothetical protein [Gossypium davidsonii]MBA0666003.1 hypothetical protein [Gossypium klotzschianum]